MRGDEPRPAQALEEQTRPCARGDHDFVICKKRQGGASVGGGAEAIAAKPRRSKGMSTTTISNDQLYAMIKKLQEENAQLKADLAKPKQRLVFKVSEKGALSIYGMGRFPITAYASQWERILEVKEEL